MMRTIFGLTILFAMASTADAKCYRTYQTTKSSYGWNHSCYSCHKPAAQAKGLSGLDEARRWMFSIAKEREESAIIQQEAKALGLSGYVKGSSGYGSHGISSYTEQSLSYPSAQYGATLYGYTAVAQPQALDKMAVMNMAARLADQSQQLAGFSFEGAKELFQTATAGEIEVAKILAQGQVASQALSAARPQAMSQQTSRTFTFQVNQTPEGQFTVQAQPQAEHGFDQARFTLDVQTYCAKCHAPEDGSDPKAGFDVRQLLKMPAEKWEQHILPRIYSNDAEWRMPPDSPPLPLDVKARFSQAAERLLGK